MERSTEGVVGIVEDPELPVRRNVVDDLWPAHQIEVAVGAHLILGLPDLLQDLEGVPRRRRTRHRSSASLRQQVRWH